MNETNSDERQPNRSEGPSEETIDDTNEESALPMQDIDLPVATFRRPRRGSANQMPGNEILDMAAEDMSAITHRWDSAEEEYGVAYNEEGLVGNDLPQLPDYWDDSTANSNFAVFAQEVDLDMATHDSTYTSDLPEESEEIQNSIDDERTVSLSVGETMLLRLLKLCKDAQVPNYFYDNMLTIIKDARKEERNAMEVLSSYPNRNKIMKKLSKLFPAPLPTKTVIGLETSVMSYIEHYRRNDVSQAQLVHWDPTEALMSILGLDRIFSNENNVTKVGNVEDRFIQSRPDVTDNTEILHGSWARHYIQNTEPWVDGLDLLCPIVVYLDETHVTGNGRVKVTPVLMACGLLNKNVRYLQENIKPLAYIPKHNPDSAAIKHAWRQGEAKGRPIRNFHKIFTVIIRSLLRMKEKLLSKRTIVRIGRVRKPVRLHCPIAFFVGDAKEMDRLAGRYGGYNCNRISRWCDTNFLDSGTAGHNCTEWRVGETKEVVLELNRWKYMDQIEIDNLEGNKQQRKRRQNEEIKRLTDRLKEISAHRVVNSLWETVDDDTALLPLPHDMMHIFTKICRLLFELTISCLSQGEKGTLDALVQKLLAKHRSSETQRFPRLTFSGGFCSITNLTSGEWIGKIFSLMVLSHLPAGKKAMKECFIRERARTNKQKKDKDKEDDKNGRNKKRKNAKGAGPEDELPPLNEVTAEEVADLFEDLLLFHAFYTVGWPYDRNVNPPMESSIYRWSQEKEGLLKSYIEGLQSKITRRFPRRLGNGWCLQTFHEMLHLARCISLYGMPDNYNADWGERALKQYGKKPARLVRKRMNDEMLESLAAKITEMDVIDQAYSVCVLQDEDETGDVNENNEEDTITHYHEKHSKYMCTVGEGILLGLQWHRKGRLKKVPSLPEAIINFFVDEYGNIPGGRFIHGYTEYNIRRTGVNDDMKFRCHPSYKSGDPWYDWCLVRFGTRNGSSYPGEQRFRGSGLTGLDQVPCKMLAIFEVEDPQGIGSTKILVHRCAGSNHKHDSCLTETWKKDSFPGTRNIPAMDGDRNILPEGEGTIEV